MNIYIKYLFYDKKTAVEAVERLIDEEGGTISSFGVGEKQYAGFDVEEGMIKFSPYTVNNQQLCLLEWTTEGDDEEAGDPDAWLSPHCFENYNTFAFNGDNIKGEECDFGIMKGE